MIENDQEKVGGEIFEAEEMAAASGSDIAETNGFTGPSSRCLAVNFQDSVDDS